MEDHYKGDSPSKKFARLKYWICVAESMGTKKFRSKKHLVLVSRVAGDIPILLHLGVKPQNIIAVDINPKAALDAQEHYPELKVICGDVVEIAKEYRREIGSAFLDFCAHLSDDYLERVLNIVRTGISDGAYIGCTFLCGREKNENLVKNLDRARVDLAKDDQLLVTDKARSALVRATVFIGTLMYKGVRNRFFIHPSDLFHYMSSSETSHGVPMATVLFRIERAAPGTSIKKMAQKLVKQHGDLPLEGRTYMPINIVDCNVTEEILREYVLNKVDELEATGLVGHDATLVAHVYNLDPKTVAAWKAHRTRGTYR